MHHNCSDFHTYKDVPSIIKVYRGLNKSYTKAIDTLNKG